ncbi:MAG: DUF4384 domain-containing protein, partial [Rubricoccaceae bacterium]|nr:DUF4384 domain-containing protein [Rubricoccaceae bacterium]
GSATRGEMATRTGGAPIGPPGAGARAPDGVEAGVVGLDAATAGTRGGGDEGLAPYVFFAAADHDELDHEMYVPGRRPRMTVGPLSYALAVSLSQMGEGETYRRLFERIEATFVEANVTLQTPQAEGDLDTRVFSGQAVVQQPYVAVTNHDPALGEVSIESGLLQGITEGSRIAFFPAGADRPDGEPLAEGAVTYASAYDAAVTLDGPAAGELTGAWGFVTRQALGDVRVPVSIGPGVAEAGALRDALSGVGILDVVEAAGAPPDRVEVRAEGDGLILVQVTDGAVLHRLTGVDPATVAARLGAYARARYLQRLALHNPDLRLRVEVLPAQFDVVRRGGRVTCAADEAAIARGAAARDAARPPGAFAAGEHYALRVTNEGIHRTYATIVSLRPDGEMTQLYPLPGTGDNALAPGASFLLPACYAASAPAGPDVLKVFATDAPLDLTLLIEGPEVQRTRGGSGLLDDLFEALYLDPAAVEAMATRGEVLGAPPRLATTSEVVLHIETP